jgi:hypothetical protein
MNIGETTEDVQHQASEIEIQTHQKLDSTLDQEPNPQITPQHLVLSEGHSDQDDKTMNSLQILSGELKFDGTQVSNFIYEFEKDTQQAYEVCNVNSSLTSEQKRNGLDAIRKFAIVRKIVHERDRKALNKSSAMNGSWSDIKEYLLKNYGALDHVTSVSDLEQLCATKHSMASNYLLDFNNILSEIPEFEKPSEKRLVELFLRGLKKEMVVAILKECRIQAKLSPSEKVDGDPISTFSSAFPLPSSLSSVQEVALQIELEKVQLAALGFASPLEDPDENPEISSLTEKLEALGAKLDKMNENRMSNSFQQPDRRCIWCDSTEHVRNGCVDLKTALEAGTVMMGEDRKLYYPTGLPVPLNFRKGGMKALSLPPRTVGSNSVSLVNSSKESLHVALEHMKVPEEMQESLNELLDRGLDAIAVKILNAFATKRNFSETEADEPETSKRVRQEASDDPVLDKDTQTEVHKRSPPSFHYAVPGLDSEKLVEETMKLVMENEIKGITLQHLIGVSGPLRKEIETKVKTKRVAFDLPQENKMVSHVALHGLHSSNRLLPLPKVKCFVSCETPKVKGTVNGVELTCYIDPGSEINLIPMSTFKKLKLPLVHVNYRMSNADATHSEILGGCSMVPVEVGGIEVPCHFFVIENANYEVLLATPWEASTRAICTTDRDAVKVYTIHSLDGKETATFVATTANSPRTEKVLASKFVQLEKWPIFMGTMENEAMLPKVFEVNTKAKRVKDKVKPVAVPLEDGSIPFKWAKLKKDESEEKNRFTKERLDAMCIGDGNLTSEEIAMFKEMLKANDKAFAWDFKQKGFFNPDIIPPYKIKTVPHAPWNLKPFPTSPALKEALVAVLKDRLENGVLEPCHGPYSNRFFLVPKNDGKFRLIIDLQPANAVTIREAMVPPHMDDLVESFSGYPLYGVFDFFSGYDQYLLDVLSRDMTAIRTPLGLLRCTTLPQGGTNSVSAFQSAAARVFSEIIPDKGVVFVDDILMRCESRKLDETEIQPGIRKYVYDFCSMIDKFLKTAIKANITFSGTKTRIAVSTVVSLGCRLSSMGRHPKPSNVERIMSWTKFESVTHVRSFLGCATFFRKWIKDFATIASPLFKLLKKNVPFAWGSEQEQAVESIKLILSSDPVIQPLDYECTSERPLILCVDSGPVGGGGYLGQDDESGNRRVNRYLSFVYNKTVQNYSQIKRELFAMIHCLKEVRYQVYGSPLIIETDCLPLLGLIKKPDPIDPTITRWVTFIRLFNPEFRHISGSKNKVADALSRRPHADQEQSVDQEETERVIDEFLSLAVTLNKEDDLKLVKKYLETEALPPNYSQGELKRIAKKAESFLILSDQLYFIQGPDRVPRRVVFDKEEKMAILESLHDGETGGHHGIQSTFKKVSCVYYWPRLYEDVKQFVQTCKPCQLYSSRQVNEPLHPVFVNSLHRRWYVDVVTVPIGQKNHSIICAREGFSGWLEAKIIPNTKAKAWIKFIQEAVISRYGCIGQVITDHGELDSEEGQKFFEKYRIQLTFSSPYHPEGNSVVERGHAPFVASLAKWKLGSGIALTHWFHAALWADRVTVKRSTGFTPYQLMFGHHCILPVELNHESWYSLSWKSDMTTEQLLENRIHQIMYHHSHMLPEAIEKINSARLKGKDYFDQKKVLRSKKLNVGDAVLLYDSSLSPQFSKKFVNKWLGPYVIIEKRTNGSYKLAEMDGTPFSQSTAGNRLKLFFTREDLNRSGDERLGASVDVV